MRFLRLCTAFVLALLLTVASFVSPVQAQTAVSTTTLSTAATDVAAIVAVASATGIDVGDYLFIEREAMLVQAVTGTSIRVTRGFAGTAARAHAASATVYLGAPTNFYQSEVTVGATCTAANESFTPRIVLPTGNVFTCTGGVWNRAGHDVGAVQAVFSQGGTAADALDTVFFVADRDYVVSKITAAWGVAESTGSMDIMVEKLTGTTACASGTDLQASAIAGTGAANTVNTATLTATSANLLVAAGNRLCVDLTATPNEVVNMVVTVTLIPR